MKRDFHKNAGGGVNMTPMIDVVFQMIIFFVCTARLEQEQFSEFIRLPDSPHASEMAQEKDPRTITIEVSDRGRVAIANTPLSVSRLKKVLVKTVADHGVHGPAIPIQIRADGRARHSAVKQVMDTCAEAGLYKIAFVAVKDSAEGRVGRKSEGRKSKVE